MTYDDLSDKEKLRVEVEVNARDLWLTSKQLSKLRNDADAGQMFSPNVMSDLYSAKTNLDLILSSLETRRVA